jgi:hypothetical protein
MANQSTINFISEEPDNFNENNPQYINPLDLAISRIFEYQEGYNITTTAPIFYSLVVDLFGNSGLRATPYNWSINEHSNSGTLSLFLRIIARRIDQEIKNRNPNDYRYSSEEQNAEVYEDWTPDNIIKAFKFLSNYDALYHSREDTVNNGLNYGYPPDYLYSQISQNKSTYNDLFEPYYPVFEWLEENGYLKYGIKEYLTYENGLSMSEFFSTYQRRILDKNTIPNDPTDPRAISIDSLRLMMAMYGFVIEEAKEIIAGTRKGYSNDVRQILSSRGISTNLKY